MTETGRVNNKTNQYTVLKKQSVALADLIYNGKISVRECQGIYKSLLPMIKSKTASAKQRQLFLLATFFLISNNKAPVGVRKRFISVASQDPQTIKKYPNLAKILEFAKNMNKIVLSEKSESWQKIARENQKAVKEIDKSIIAAEVAPLTPLAIPLIPIALKLAPIGFAAGSLSCGAFNFLMPPESELAKEMKGIPVHIPPPPNNNSISEEGYNEILAMTEKVLNGTDISSYEVSRIEYKFRTDEPYGGRYISPLGIIEVMINQSMGYFSDYEEVLNHELGHARDSKIPYKDKEPLINVVQWKYKGKTPTVWDYDNLDRENWESLVHTKNDLLYNRIMNSIKNGKIAGPEKNEVLSLINKNRKGLDDNKVVKDKILSLIPKENKEEMKAVIFEKNAHYNPKERFAQLHELWKKDTENFVTYALLEWGGMEKNSRLIEELEIFSKLVFKKERSGEIYYQTFKGSIPSLKSHDELFDKYKKDFKELTFERLFELFKDAKFENLASSHINYYIEKKQSHIKNFASLLSKSLKEDPNGINTYGTKINLISFMYKYALEGLFDKIAVDVLIESIATGDGGWDASGVLAKYAEVGIIKPESLIKLLEEKIDSQNARVALAVSSLLKGYIDKGGWIPGKEQLNDLKMLHRKITGNLFFDKIEEDINYVIHKSETP